MDRDGERRWPPRRRPPTAGDFDKAVASSKEAEALAKASIFQATSEKAAPGKTTRKSAEHCSEEARRHRMTIRRRDFLKLAGAAALCGRTAAIARSADNPSVYDLERFGNARILHMTDTPCAAAAGVFSRAQRQSRDRRDAGQAAASGRPRLSRPLRHQARQRRRLRLHLSRFREIRRALRQARRLCASEDADRPAAQRRRRRAARCCSTAAICGRAPDRPTPCRAPTWSRPRICSASRR